MNDIPGIDIREELYSIEQAESEACDRSVSWNLLREWFHVG
ncbi:MAG: hypothetical protein ACI8VW_002516 [bacterium]|jgi:hypothetical protein